MRWSLYLSFFPFLILLSFIHSIPWIPSGSEARRSKAFPTNLLSPALWFSRFIHSFIPPHCFLLACTHPHGWREREVPRQSARIGEPSSSQGQGLIEYPSLLPLSPSSQFEADDVSQQGAGEDLSETEVQGLIVEEGHRFSFTSLRIFSGVAKSRFPRSPISSFLFNNLFRYVRLIGHERS